MAKRIEKINESINKHFPSNNDAWWVSENTTITDMVELHRGAGGNKINPIWVAKHIFNIEPTINIVHYGGMCMIYTRESVKNYNY